MSETQERFVEDDKQNATTLPMCSFCLGDCDKPRILNCGHIVCSECLARRVQSTEVNDSFINLIVCPRCQKACVSPATLEEAKRRLKPTVTQRPANAKADVVGGKEPKATRRAVSSEPADQERQSLQSPLVDKSCRPTRGNSEADILSKFTTDDEKTELQITGLEPVQNDDVLLRLSSLFRIATKKNVVGVVEFQGRIYIANRDSSKIQVFINIPASLPSEENLKLHGEIQIAKSGKLFSNAKSVDPGDLVVCPINKCLYVSDTDNWCVYRVAIDQPNQVSHWIALSDMSAGCKCKRHLVLSVMSDGRLLLVRDKPPRLECHTGDDSKCKPFVVELPEDMREPMHAIELATGHFIVSHGWTRSPLRRLCEVTKQGKIVRSFGGICGFAGNQLNCPSYITTEKDGRIFVADYFNNRVLVVDATLTKSRVLLKWKPEEESPMRLFYSAEMRRLFVAMSDEHVDVYSTEKV